MQEWKTEFRKWIAPQLSTKGLKALAKALQTNDPQLVTGVITEPWRLPGEAAVVRACPIGYCGWKGGRRLLKTVTEVYAFFNKVTGMAPVDRFIEFVDDTPRDTMRRQLLVEVNRVLKEREAVNG